MIALAWPWVLIFLPLPLLVYFLYKTAPQQSTPLNVPFYQRLISIPKQAVAHTPSLISRRSLPLILLLIIWLCLVVAGSKPQWVGDATQYSSSGRDLMLAVDISGSMEQTDLQLQGQYTTRLNVVKSVLKGFIERRKGDRIGLILFGSQAFLQSPLTFDRQTVSTLLDEAQIGFAGKKTAIGDAIGLSVKRLRQRPENSRLLILLTDGANSAGQITPLKATELAQQEHIKIYTIGVGATEMIQPGLFGGNFGARKVNPSADLDERTLSEIAERTNGYYFRAKDTQELEKIYTLLDQLEPTVQEDEVFNPTRSLYQWPLFIALLLSVVLFFITIGFNSINLNRKNHTKTPTTKGNR